MRIFFDTEFNDTGKTVDLISIGLVRSDGREYYAECAEYDRNGSHEWLVKNVHPYLHGPVKPRQRIAADLIEFAGAHPEFWAYHAAYDWLCLCQLYGTMLSAPPTWPHFVNDLQCLRYWNGVAQLPKQTGTEHNALDDARWNRDVFAFLTRRPESSNSASMDESFERRPR